MNDSLKQKTVEENGDIHEIYEEKRNSISFKTTVSKWTEYLCFKLTNNKVQINMEHEMNKKKKQTTTNNNARSYHEKAKCLINNNQQIIRINNEGK